MRYRTMWGAALLVGGLLVGLAGCGGGEPRSQAPTTEEQVEQPAPTPPKTEGTSEQALIDQGRQLAQSKGCLSCHTTDGSASVGPTWKGLYGKEETLADGTKVKVDEAYLRESIAQPGAKIVQGFSNVMPPYELSEEELKALIAYLKSLSE